MEENIFLKFFSAAHLQNNKRLYTTYKGWNVYVFDNGHYGMMKHARKHAYCIEFTNCYEIPADVKADIKYLRGNYYSIKEWKHVISVFDKDYNPKYKK